MSWWKAFTVLSLFLVLFVRVAFADRPILREAVTVDDVAQLLTSDWNINVGTTIWLPPVEGSQIKNGLQSNVEASQSERIDRYSASGELFLEFTNNKWTFVFQPQISDTQLDGTTLTPFGDIPLSVSADIVLFEYWTGRRFGKDTVWTEIVFGGRHVELNVDAQSPLGPDTTDYDWHDPLVGVRNFVTLNGKWSLESLITASGFGATDDSTDRSWEARAFGRYQVKPRWNIQFGYRYFKTKYTEQENNPPTSLKYKLSGPFVATSVKVK